ncbi:UDP-glucose 4-epimerase GalE [Stenotrophomonas sp.]|uniref:UDP-glucose 4-epimerase GalE n=1 Tax=Stenotrophomonas sp. TaxID=69392 RepID=UPI002D4912C3|nr:UDP-glucose 4-epimerase GalE [Stenotrophomonas sp.]HYQ25374.1 UDP-glucose 4-epimerase GalE [Stenotrophomonas sp.]
MSEAILVTGGAGYIGCHVVHQLLDRNFTVVVLDDLSTGKAKRVENAHLVIGSISDHTLVKSILSEFAIGTVVHMAARTDATGSKLDPLHYYSENTAGTLNLLSCCKDCGVSKFVFTSTAAVYGSACDQTPVGELHSERPANPYGMSKLIAEQILLDISFATGLRYVSLRCFNVAGATMSGHFFRPAKDAKNLVMAACRVANERQGSVTIFGTDFRTPDGTGIRDYVHVDDIAAAHLRAIDHLNRGGSSLILNCGSERGYSVREVLHAVEQISGARVPVLEAEQRSGDVSVLVSDSSSARRELSWSPRNDGLDSIVRSALRSEQA